MKNLIASLILLFSMLTCVAQKDTLKSRDTDWGVAVDLSGLINNIALGNVTDVNGNRSLLIKHHLKDKEVLRLGFGLNTIRNKTSTSDSISLPSGNRALFTKDSVEKRGDFSLAIGMEKHLGNSRRLDPYIGADVIVGRVGNTKIDVNAETVDVTGTGKSQKIIQRDGGFAFGLKLISGFNFFIAERISIGAEVNFGYSYVTSGGDENESTVDTPVSGAQSSSFTKRNSVSSSAGFNINSSTGLLFSYFF